MIIESLSQLKKEFSILSVTNRTIYRERLYLVIYILKTFYKEIANEIQIILEDCNYDLEVLEHLIESYEIYELRDYILYGGEYEIEWSKYKEAQNYAIQTLKKDLEKEFRK